MLPHNYFNDPTNYKEIEALILNPKISVKDITTKYGFSRQRLYQIITMNNLPTKHRTRKNSFKETYGNNPIMWQLSHSLTERKSYFNRNRTVPIEQDATINDLLVEGNLPCYCPIFGIKLTYNTTGARTDATASIDKIDNSKGYIKGNVAIICWRANKIKNEGTYEEHMKIATFIKNSLKT